MSYNKVKIRRGSGIPDTNDLVTYELGYDYANNKLYIHDGDSGSIVPLTSNPIVGGTHITLVSNSGSTHINVDNLPASKITSGTFADARIPNLGTSKITSGTFADARIAASNVTQHLDLGSGNLHIKKTGGNNTNNYAAVEVYSAGLAENQAAIAIQQQTSEGDTIIFADFEPHVEWGISADNSLDEIHFTGGSSTGSLGTKTFKNNAGANRTAYKKMSVGLSNGNVSIGGALTTGKVDIVSQGNARTLDLTANNDGTNGSYSVSMLMHGYENRGNGIFMTDSGTSGMEWFTGLPYQHNGGRYQIGYHASNGESEYITQARLDLRSGSTGNFLHTDSGYIQFGPLNTGGCHIYTDRSLFYFNKRLIVGVTSGESIIAGYNGQSDFVIDRASNAYGNDEYRIQADRHRFKVNGNVRFEVISNRCVVTAAGPNGLELDTTTDDSGNSARIFLKGSSTSCIFQQGADLSFRTGATSASSSGTERMLINSSGNVGIGAAAPSSKLEVSHVQNAESLLTLHNNRQDASNVPIFGIAGKQSGTIVGKMSFYRGGGGNSGYMTFSTKEDNSASLTEKMRLDGAGKLGIGTASPETLLHVKAADSVTGVLKIEGGKNTVTASGEINARLEFGSNDTSVNSTGNVGASIATHTSTSNGAWNDLVFSTFKQSDPGLREVMRLDKLGQLGIGTASPNTKLHISDTSSNNLVSIKVQNSLGTAEFGAQSGYARIYSGGTLLHAHGPSIHYHYIGGNAIMALNGTGLGIGNVTPAYKLDVTGNVRFTSDLRNEARLLNSVGSASSPSYSFFSQGNAGMYRSGNGVGFSANGASVYDINSTRMYINTNVGVGTSSPNAKFHVSHNGSSVMKAESTAGGYGAYARLTTTTNSYSLYGLNGDFGIDEDGVATRFIIKDSTGHVGFNESSPTTELHLGTCPDARTITFDQSGRFNGIGSYFSSNAADSQIWFHLSTGGTDGGENVRMKVYADGRLKLVNSANVEMTLAKATRMGYSASYKALVIGETSGTFTTAIAYDPSTNASPAFTGDGRELIFRNGVEFTTPNAANNSFHNDVVVLKDGKVGISTASPSYKLDVDGDIRAQNGHVFYGDSTSGVLSTGSWAGDLTSNGWERVAGLSHDGGEFVLVEKNGQVSTLIDGSYFAYEAGSNTGGGFWSSSNSSYAAATGIIASGGTLYVKQADGTNASFYVTGDTTTNGYISSKDASTDLRLRRGTNDDDIIIIEASQTRIIGDAVERARFGSWGIRNNVNGSEGSPSYSFVSDTNTGIYRYAADAIGFTAGGTMRSYMDSSKLFISQPVRIQFANDQRIFDDGGGGLKVGSQYNQLTLFGGTNTGEIRFLAGGRSGTERVRFDASGNGHFDADVVAFSSTAVSYTHLTLPTNREV